MTRCQHLNEFKNVEPKTRGCEECLATGESWVHLRMCRHCGHVGCCDSSANHHATRHFRETGHPIIQSAEPGEDWCYCYIDEVQLSPEHFHRKLAG